MTATINASTSAGVVVTSDTSGSLALQTANTTAITIDTSQNVGLGVTPSAWGTSKNFELPTLVFDGLDYSFGNNYYQNSGYRYTSSNPATKISLYNGQFQFFTAPTGTTGNTISFTPVMTLDNSGNLLVGVTSGSTNTYSKASGGTYVLSVKNTSASASDSGLQVVAGNGTSGVYIVSCESNSASVFRIYGNGTYGTISDINLKKNIETSRGYLDDLLKLRVVKYNWKTQEDTEAKELGFIAQEVEQVFPSLVESSSKENEETNKLIKQPVLIPMLVKAIQELNTLVTTQAQTITAMQSTITALQAKLGA